MWSVLVAAAWDGLDHVYLGVGYLTEYFPPHFRSDEARSCRNSGQPEIGYGGTIAKDLAFTATTAAIGHDSGHAYLIY
jgi:hypothetical protein